jgi:hypothetical protein
MDFDFDTALIFILNAIDTVVSPCYPPATQAATTDPWQHKSYSPRHEDGFGAE